MTSRTVGGRTELLGGGGVLSVATVLAAILVGTDDDPTRLPVTAAFPTSVLGHDDARRVLTRIDLGVGVTVVLGLLAVALLVAGLRRGAPTTDGTPAPDPTDGRRPLGRWTVAALASTASSVTVFLIAQCNGVQDLGALVLVYAVIGGVALLVLVRDRSGTDPAGHTPAMSTAAVVGIVPWGVIAFHQVAAGFVGESVPAAVRIVTLAMLAAAAVVFVGIWRDHGSYRSGTVRVLAVTSVLAGVVLLVGFVR